MLEPNEETATQARATASRLIEVADALVAYGLDVPAENRQAFQHVYGWWRLVTRTAAEVLLVTERGFAAPEVAPLLRNILNHAYAIHWLVDNGEPAIAAVISCDNVRQTKMVDKLESTGWAIAAEYRAQLALRAPEPARTADEQKRHQKLVGEIANVENLFKVYGSGDVYPVYAHLSSMSHTSINTASAYLSRRNDGSIEYLSEPVKDSPAYAEIIQLAVALIQAGLAVSPLLAGNPMSSALDNAISDLGMQNTQFLPPREKRLD
ncbi:DUF5677 domain-containing protein [Frankia tisae]|uniref:DUF5677 domain-containing protein n=1 Tax=Frankia tisae TaxID=2950104 RepID=UPI0021C12A8B|nr:DUF5677 domain-containing protein [Frankia tisae]